MSRNSLYLIIGVLVAVVVGVGIYLYNEQTKPGLEVRVDGQGITVEGNG
jgi:hypothetical protein